MKTSSEAPQFHSLILHSLESAAPDSAVDASDVGFSHLFSCPQKLVLSFTQH